MSLTRGATAAPIMLQIEPIKVQDLHGLQQRGLELQINAGSRSTRQQRNGQIADDQDHFFGSETFKRFFLKTQLGFASKSDILNAVFSLPEQFKHSSAVSVCDCPFYLKAEAKNPPR